MTETSHAHAIFRAMRAAADGFPVLGPSARELGVRVVGAIVDLRVAADGSVEPRAGGMSVAFDEAQNLRPPDVEAGKCSKNHGSGVSGRILP